MDSRDETPITLEKKRRILSSALTQDKLELILFPTEQCNFRCTYCYEDFEKGRMSPSVISGVKALIEHRAANLKHLNLSWFGGEPLIAYDIVSEVSRHAVALSELHGFSLSGSVTSNAYKLTRERARDLSSFGIKLIQVSLDGHGFAHDQTRQRIDGAGTFDIIWRRLLEFQEEFFASHLDCKVLLRIHVHQLNLESVHQLFGMIADQLDPRAFRVMIKPVGKWGGKNDAGLAVLKESHSDWASVVAAYRTVLADFQDPEAPEEVYVCYAAKANSFTIRSDGSVGKCTVALRDPANNVGMLAADGKLNIEADKFSRWLHGLSSLQPEDLGCPAANLPRQPKAALEQAAA